MRYINFTVVRSSRAMRGDQSTMNTVTFEAINRCIYCGVNNAVAELSDEHIIPLSLNGMMILPSSSCKLCAAVTSKFELVCAREIYGQFRRRYSLKTRRPKKRQTEVTVELTTVDGNYGVVVKPDEIPTLMPFFYLGPAGCLHEPPNLIPTWERATVRVKDLGIKDPTLLNRIGPTSSFYSQSVKCDIDNFARLCAKIGHGFAVSLFGEGSFEAWLPPYILGKNNNLAFVVGASPSPPSTGEATEPPSNWKVAHKLNWSVYETSAYGPLLAIDMHLFPSFGQPPILAIVGKISPSLHEALITNPKQFNNPALKLSVKT